MTRNQPFFEGTVRQVFSEAFNFPVDQDITIQRRKGKFSSGINKILILRYSSLAVGTFFLDYLGYPSNRQDRRTTGLTPEIERLGPRLKDEFLKFFLAGSVTFFSNDGSPMIRINDVSEPLLQDIKRLLLLRNLGDALRINTKGGTRYSLTIGTIPTKKLFSEGFLDENPRIKDLGTHRLKSPLPKVHEPKPSSLDHISDISVSQIPFGIKQSIMVGVSEDLIADLNGLPLLTILGYKKALGKI